MVTKIKFYQPILGLLLTGLCVLPCQALTIIGKLGPKQGITLFYGGENMCRLINHSENDTTIIREVSITGLTEFRYSVGYKIGNKLMRARHTMLLLPTDKLVFKKEGNELVPLSKPIASIFLDQHIDVGFYAIEEEPNPKKQTLSEFDSYVKNQLEKFKRDSSTIQTIYKTNILTEEERQKWTDFTRITFIAKIFRLAEDKQNFKVELYKDLFDEALAYVGEQNINGDLMSIMFTNLSNYWVRLQNNTRTKKTDFVDFYIENRNKINAGYIHDAFVKYIKNFSDKTSLTYTNNVARIRNYAVAYDQKLIDKTFNIRFLDMEKVNLKNIKNETITLNQVAFNAGKKYLFIDMWASWCIPCREQLPTLEQFKEKFAVEDILFLNVSTDKERVKWVKALEEEGVSRQPYQFRLVNSQQSELTTFFNIVTIPRYLILDRTGMVINDRFYLPTDPEFKPALISVLEKK